ncbi:MAG: HlyD family efflux transporter periplasmic adaptor subunit [Acidobacteriota bacterium]
MVDIARPDLPLARRRRRLIVGGIGLAVLVVVSAAVSKLQPAAPVVERGAVWIDTVKRGPMARDVRGTGSLVPEDLRWIPAGVDGRVERIVLRPGASVTPETVVVELSNPELQQAVRDAELQLQSVEAQLANRRVELERDVLATESAMGALEAEARDARQGADAEAALQAEGLTSALALRTKRSKADSLDQRVTLERRRFEMQRGSLATQLAIPEADVDRQRATLEQKRVQVAGLHVRAGVSGVLQQVLVELGARVSPGANLVRVVDPTRLKAELKVAETQAKDLQVGLRASIDTRNGVIAGRVSRIDPAATGGTVTVDVSLDGGLPKGARPDLTVDGTIEIDRLADVVSVGRPANGEEGGTVQIFRLDATGHAVRVPVTLGRMSVNAVEIRAGLKPGDEVILSDMSTWSTVDRVRIK